MSLTRDKMMARNLDLAENHLLGILEHPERLSGIPDEAEVIFLPADDPELLEANLAMANQIIREMSRNRPQEPVILVLLPTQRERPAEKLPEPV